ncbi:MAG: VanZ family protein [Deltaproteobacteria bacterium]|nr:VanZ family protein [Deltaproteobacteria bacterium]
MLRALPAVAWALVIFFASSIPRLDLGPNAPSDKVLHLIAYAVFGGFIVFALVGHRRFDSFARRVAFAAILATLYGVTDEVHQSFVPGRFPDAADALADAVGAMCWGRGDRRVVSVDVAASREFGLGIDRKSETWRIDTPGASIAYAPVGPTTGEFSWLKRSNHPQAGDAGSRGDRLLAGGFKETP